MYLLFARRIRLYLRVTLSTLESLRISVKGTASAARDQSSPFPLLVLAMS